MEKNSVSALVTFINVGHYAKGHPFLLYFISFSHLILTQRGTSYHLHFEDEESEVSGNVAVSGQPGLRKQVV